MERFTLFYALAELAKNEKNRHEFKEICLMYAVGLIIVVLSYPLIRHLA
jgi:NADH:ubiquinone oxidoreductase subunit 2 (subunit N)